MATTKKNGRFELPEALHKLYDEQLRDKVSQLEARSKKIEHELRQSDWYRKAKRWQRDVEKRARGVQKDFEKRARGVQKDLEKVRTDAYHAAGLATKAEVDALNRKLRQLGHSADV